MHRKRRNMNGCYWCHRPMKKHDVAAPIRDGRARTKDHMHPKSGGGIRTVPCCYACNQLKGSMSVRVWLSFMTDYPRWWLQFPDLSKAQNYQKERDHEQEAA